jgi:16S rRNA processing protein RimM
LRGEVSVTLATNRTERLEPGSVLFAADREIVVTAARPHQGRWLVCFEGVDDRDAADALKGALLTGDPLGDLPDDEVWLHELVGAEVLDASGSRLGAVTAVEANPAHDLLVVDGELLVPVVFMVEQRPGVVVVDPPDGLLEVNRRA